ncbi:MAG: lipid A biosynthesis acyltransferase [Gammaproteobacteria bacterium]|nr:lipid A biosynthesis acyltransferase [Gammaproteobacteria bacterium]
MNSVIRKTAAGRAIAFHRLRLRRAHFAPRHWGMWLVVLFLGGIALLPLIVSRALGALFGWLMYLANAKRRRIARVNLRLCFPEKSERQRRRLLRRHYRVYGQSFTDLGHLAWNSRKRLKRMVRFRGIQHYRDQLRQGRHVILLVPHCVGMNLGGAVLSAEHATFSMYKPQRNAVVNWFINRGRMRFGAELLGRQQGLRPVVHGLQQGRVFYYLPDEDFGPKHSVFAPFFGVSTATLPTLGRLTGMTDAVVIPCFARLLPWGRGYEVVLYPPLADFPTGNALEDATHMNQALEVGIRAMPEQYLWTFKLFKTRPKGAPSPYG